MHFDELETRHAPLRAPLDTHSRGVQSLPAHLHATPAENDPVCEAVAGAYALVQA